MYLDIGIYFSERGAVKVSITGYIDESVDEFPKDFITPVVSPASDHLFKINISGKCLSYERTILFVGLS